MSKNIPTVLKKSFERRTYPNDLVSQIRVGGVGEIALGDIPQGNRSQWGGDPTMCGIFLENPPN